MMYQLVIARRYARGLMLATKAADLDTIDEELTAIVDLVRDEKSPLANLFSDPAFSPLERKAVVDQIVQKYELNPVIHHFLGLLIEKGRLKLLPAICDEFKALLDEHYGRLRAVIRSASPVEDAMLGDITSALKKMCKKEILADVAVDSSLLAGLRVEIGGMVIDGSAKAKLAAMKDQLVYSIESISV